MKPTSPPTSPNGAPWRRVSWNALPTGQPVRLSQDGRPIGSGVVDGSTPDGSIIWVVLDGWRERRMFHREDYVQVEIGA
jgi:hypothetical protein